MDLERTTAYAMRMGNRQAIVELEQLMHVEGITVSRDTCPVRHHFAPHCYAREMFLPAGICVVGKIHKHAHVNTISQGRVSVLTEQEGVQTLHAPLTFVSSPGTKRVVWVHEDTVWTTVHVTEETDLAKIEAEIIATSFEELAL